MTILHVVRCEQYEQCKQQFPITSDPLRGNGIVPPDSWMTLFVGNPHTSEPMHFCSKACLFNWLLDSGQQKPASEPQDKPDCKARRFLLVDESANITEGVKWGNGTVTLESSILALYQDWEQFKESFPGCGVQWIDQEVSE